MKLCLTSCLTVMSGTMLVLSLDLQQMVVSLTLEQTSVLLPVPLTFT